ncbi:MAG TPA: hypothetical protein VNO32_47135 [Candidatus Acidoferrum sp.]|nr:hypothetical protein [Candidatus Acidoferrum sp.]
MGFLKNDECNRPIQFVVFEPGRRARIANSVRLNLIASYPVAGEKIYYL